ncbi:nitroreductase family protein, partial [Pseudacidovorax intermedius]|uniref:nitroreductase family protein n=1 Tax=Pseudacidovorax intermedius TaxID=433924 RepID=UPI0026EDDF61
MSTPRQPAHPIDPLFTERWSPRAFTEEAIPEPALMSLLEAARWAPLAYNVQPWRFIYARRDTAAWQPIFDSLVEFNQM